MENSAFLRVQCPRCKNNQITYSKATIWVKCKICNKLLIKPKGGNAKVRAPINRIIKHKKNE